MKTYCIPTIDGNFKETILPDSFLIKIDAKAENFLKLMSLFHSSVTRMALQATATESSGVSKIRVRSVEDPGKGKHRQHESILHLSLFEIP